MRLACPTQKLLALFGLILFSYSVKSQDYSAGINTETPNSNAVLHLVSPGNNQGLLIPVLTGAQRSLMTSSLTATDNGMLVFDSTDGLFYFWFNNWFALSTKAAGSVTTAQILDGTIIDADVSAVGWAKITGVPPGFADGTDDVTDPDADATNELITAGTLVGNTLTITEAGVDHTIDLSTFASAPQDLQFTASVLSITGDPTPTSVDFSAWDQNASDDLTTAAGSVTTTQILDGTIANIDIGSVDWTKLTGIPAGFADGTDDGGITTVAVDGSTIAGDGVGTPLAVGTIPAGQVSGLSTVATVGVTTDITLVGDGTAGTPLSLNRVDPSIIIGAGATNGQILQFNGTNWIPANNVATVVSDGTTITGDGSGTPLAIGSVPLTNLAAGVATPSQNIEFNGTNWAPGTDDIALADGTTITGDGSGTPYAVNVGTGINQIVQLDGTGALPAVDGSNLTGVVATVTTDGTTIAGDGSGTALSVSSVPLTTIAAGGATLGQSLEFNGTNWIPATDDVGMLATTYDPNTVTGDAFDFSTHASTTAAVAGNVLTFDGTNWDAAAPAGLTTVSVDGTTITGDGSGTPLAVNSVPLTTIAAGVATLGQNLEFNGTNWIPATDDVGMLATTYDPNTVAGDAFNFSTHSSTTAAVAGNVLTFDGTNWDAAAPAGLTLPYSQSVDNASDLFALENINAISGGGGNFAINNVLNSGIALSAATNGTGSAIGATTNGTGSGITVSHSGATLGTGVAVAMTSATGTGPAISVNHAGLGAGIEINTTTGPPLFISGGALGEVLTSDAAGNITLQPGGLTLPYSQTLANVGDLFFLTNTDATSGGAGNFAINNAANAGNALTATTNGTGAAFRAQQTGPAGPGIDLSVTGAANPSPALFISHAGTGGAIDINTGAPSTVPGINIITSGTSQAINASTTGSGSAGRFEINNGSNASPVIDVVNTGVGPDIRLPSGATAGYVLTSDATGNATWQAGGFSLPYTQTVTGAATDLFYLINDGTGGAGAFQIANAANIDNALSVNTNGSGSVILASHTGASGSGIDVSITGAGNPSAGILVNHAGTGPGIEVTSAGGPNIRLNGATPFQIPTGAALGYVLTSVDASGNTVWAPPLTLPYANTVSNAGTLFDITNSGAGAAASFTSTGIAALFSTTGATSAIQVNGDIEFLDGSGRNFGILPSLVGPGDALTIISGNAGGAGGAGGDLNLRSGAAFTSGNGGNIILEPGTGAGGGNFGGVFVNGITRFGNPNAGFGGAIELEDDGGANSIVIQADPSTGAYAMTLPTSNGSGVLTNDGLGVLSWGSAGGFTAPLYEDATNVVFGSATPTQVLPSPGFQLGAVAPGAGGQAMLTATSHGIQSLVPLIRGNGNQGGELALQAADVIGGIEFIGYDGGGYIRQGTMRGIATENWTGATRGTDIGFSVTPNGSISEQEMLRISGSGVGIGTISPSAQLDVQVSGAGTPDVVSITNDGDARSLVVDVANLANASPAILLAQNSLGVGIDARITNSSSTSTLMTAQHQGTGSVAFFNQANLSSTNPVVSIGKTGTGPDIQLSGAGTVFNYPSATVGHVLTVSNAAGDITLQPVPSGGFAVDGGENIYSSNSGVSGPVGTDNFAAGGPGGVLAAPGSGLGVGNNNIMIGPGAGGALAGGSSNFLMGFDAGGNNMINGSNNIIFGSNSINSDDTGFNVGIGDGVTVANGYTVSIGASSSVTGINTVGIGSFVAGQGDDGVAIGYGALVGPASAGNIAIGRGSNASGNASVAIGLGAIAPQDNSAIIGDIANPLDVGIGTNLPNARLDVVKAAGETGDIVNLTHNGASGRGIYVRNASGGGDAGRFEITGGTNADAAIFATTVGTGAAAFLGQGGTAGNGLVVDFTNTGNATSAIEVANAGLGQSINLRSTNALNSAATIMAEHQGDGNVAFFSQTNVGSGADVMFSQTTGLGAAGVFQINNTGSNAPALAVNTNGNNSNALEVNKSGTNGIGLLIDMNNQGAQGIFVGGTNTNSSSIETDGNVVFRRNLITPAINHDANIIPIPSDARIVKINNAGPDVDQIAAGVEGQEIILIGDTGVPGFNIINGGNLRLDNNSTHPMTPGASIHFIYIETLSLWVEISRSR
ncbi:MAG: beta strand repeat-containing protein [Bacteroidota bacterium]